MVSSKVDFVPFCHSVLDTESSEFSHLWIPAFAGMTVFGLLTSSSSFASGFHRNDDSWAFLTFDEFIKLRFVNMKLCFHRSSHPHRVWVFLTSLGGVFNLRGMFVALTV
jgi:hypothetical protein